jgi:hypothetical protein
MSSEAERGDEANRRDPAVGAWSVRASNFAVQGNSNECLLLVGETRPSVGSDGVLGDSKTNLAVVLGMSPQSAKDLLVVLGEYIDRYEQEYGVIVTDFIKNRANADNKQ